MPKPANQYENAVVDVPELYVKHRGPLHLRHNPLRALYRSSLLPFKLRRLLWQVFTQTHLDIYWFVNFKRYWSATLGLRPLWGVEDFYFLRSWYRIGFQTTEVENTNNAQTHLKAWQTPSVLYFLMQQVYVETKYRDFEILRLTKKHLKKRNPKYLEYGSGIGPVTQTFIDFDPKFESGAHFVADIETVAFHYALQRFGSYSNIKTLPLTPANNLQLKGVDSVDAIFCITVFEHMNEPLETMKHFHRILSPGGLLFFDYIKGEGTGLDTLSGVRDRLAVLDFVEKNFEILQTPGGKIDPNETLGLTLARRK